MKLKILIILALAFSLLQLPAWAGEPSHLNVSRNLDAGMNGNICDISLAKHCCAYEEEHKNDSQGEYAYDASRASNYDDTWYSYDDAHSDNEEGLLEAVCEVFVEELLCCEED
jgi:hypothetical protein